MAISRQEQRITQEDLSWTLTPEQMLFLMQRENMIEAAYAAEEMSLLDAIAESREYLELFGSMSFDEAYDRYESTLDEDAS